MVKVKQGDVWLSILDPAVGSEIQKTRPCLIVSPPELHNHLHTVIVLPMTTGGFPTPYRVSAHFDNKHGLILPDQIRTLDKQRLIKRLGEIDAPTLSIVLKMLRDLFAE